MKKLLVLTLACIMLLSVLGCAGTDYKKATELFNAGSYPEAEALFLSLADYKDSADMATESHYQQGLKLYQAKDYASAIAALETIPDYKDSADLVLDAHYQQANALFESGDYAGAAILFESLAGYQDSADKILECKYRQAAAVYAEGDLANAVAMFDEIRGYKDVDALYEEASLQLMKETYAGVVTLLEESGTWFYNGGSDTEINGITFTGWEAKIDSAYIDGNGMHMKESSTVPFTVNDEALTVSLESGYDLVIPYSVNGGVLRLGSGEYRTYDMVQNDLLGYWTCRYTSNVFGVSLGNEVNMYIDAKTITYEKANEGYNLPRGQYYYYKKSFSYSLSFGRINNTSSGSAMFLFFNIIDNRAVVLEFTRVFKPGSRLPGRNGYSF